MLASFFQLQHKLGMLVVDTTFCLEDGGGQSFVLQQRTEKKLSSKLHAHLYKLKLYR